MFAKGDEIRNMKTGEVGVILRIEGGKRKYPVVATFDKNKLKNMRLSEYEIEVYTSEGHSDWRFYSKTIEKIGCE